MEWVETTGRTLEDAKEAALDELGVDAEDAEFEVLEEPKQGLFGRMRSEGRVRARVRPVAPPSKDDRRRRGRTGRSSGPRSTSAKATAGAPAEATLDDDPAGDVDGPVAEATGEGDGGRPRSRRRSGGGRRPAAQPERADDTEHHGSAAADSMGATEDEPTAEAHPPRGGSRSAGSRSGDGRRSGRRPGGQGPGGAHRQESDQEGSDVEVALEEQATVATEFLRGLVEEFGLTAEITSSQPDDDTLELMLRGSDLGLLIGPKGSTLLAIQDLTRTVVQRKTGAGNGRIHVDVGGYRQQRAQALSRFALQVAEQVKSSGERKALEPMSAPDRKVVHDALTEVDGVTTMSEGEDSRRRVVISPAS